MNMDPAQRELFRQAILRVAEANGTRFGMAAPAIGAHVVRFGFRATQDQVTEECAYLVDKGLLAEVMKQVSPENRVWRITAAGRDLLATEG